MQEIQNIAPDSMLINFDEFRRVDGTINLFELAKHVFERSPAYSSQPFPELLAIAFDAPYNQEWNGMRVKSWKQAYDVLTALTSPYEFLIPA